MKHITHFRIESDLPEPERRGNNVVYAYLDTSSYRWTPYEPSKRDQARIIVCQGSQEECEQFIVEQQNSESMFQWLGYVVAGGIGAVITIIFT